jgi:ribosomal-protein-alanine N-acetyltransferase
MTAGAEITVRAEADVALLAAIHAACFDDAWTEDAFTSLLASPGCFALVAQLAGDDGPPAGMILARVAGEDCEIITIGVRPPARRRGIATLLLDHTVPRALGLGATRQVLEVGVENGPARGLYASLGFAECGKRRGYYGAAGGDAVILARDIRPVPQTALRE